MEEVAAEAIAAGPAKSRRKECHRRISNAEGTQPRISLLECGTAAARRSEKDKEPAGRLVDTGSFGVFMNGHRVATESFPSSRSNGGDSAASRNSRKPRWQQPFPASAVATGYIGALMEYEWKEVTREKRRPCSFPTTICWSNARRTIRRTKRKSIHSCCRFPPVFWTIISYPPGNSGVEVSGDGLPQDKGQVTCPQNQQVKFGAINPHQRSSLLVSMPSLGKKKSGKRHGAGTQSLCAQESMPGNGRCGSTISSSWCGFWCGRQTEVVRD